jgi:N-acetylglucosamine-6-phosphate deacetylase
VIRIRTILANGTVITPIRALHSSSVIVEGGRIAAVLPSDQVEMQEQDRVIDVGGAYIAPGFIDIHTHGAGGHDFMDGSVEAIMEAARTHLRYGTTTIMPTTLTSDLDELFDTLDKFAQAKSKLKDGPNLHGLHLEGPYFSREQAGAQDPRYIKNPDPDEYRRIVGYSGEVKRWTIAPELPGALEMGRYLSERGILCSMGHTNAVYEDVVAAVENGFRLVTHLYSAMSGVRRINAYRYAGVIESALLLDELTVGHIFKDVQVGIEGVALEHHPDVAPEGRNAGDVLIVVENAAGTEGLQTCCTAQQGGLAAATGAKQTEEFSRFNGEGHFFQCVYWWISWKDLFYFFVSNA